MDRRLKDGQGRACFSFWCITNERRAKKNKKKNKDTFDYIQKFISKKLLRIFKIIIVGNVLKSSNILHPMHILKEVSALVVVAAYIIYSLLQISEER